MNGSFEFGGGISNLDGGKAGVLGGNQVCFLVAGQDLDCDV